MIVELALFVILLVVIFFLARSLTQSLFLFFYFLVKEKERAIQLLTWLLLPGTVIHELSHLLVAELLRVPTGELSFTPEIRENNEVRAGGLKIAKTGPLRHSLIGLAPSLVGITSLTALSYFGLIPLWKKISQTPIRPLYYQQLISNLLLIFLVCYLIFILSNTMFSSKKDLETILFPILIISIIVLALFLGKIQVQLSDPIINLISQIFKSLNLALFLTVIIDLIFLLLIKLLTKKPTPINTLTI